MLQPMLQRMRHRRLMNVASRLVYEAEAFPSRGGVQSVTADQMIHAWFGRTGQHIEPSEATEYLAAALVSRGCSTQHLQLTATASAPDSTTA